MATSLVSIAVAEKKEGAQRKRELVTVKQNTDPNGAAGRQVLPSGMFGQLPVPIDYVEERDQSQNHLRVSALAGC